MNIIVLGAPGSGKGTMAKILSKQTNLPHISTGDILRETIAQGTEIGNQVSSYMNEGKLVPDELVINIMKARLKNEDAKNGAILDGFPRTIKQAKALDEFLSETGESVTLVPELVIPDDVIIQRILNRAICSNKKCGAIYNTKFKPPKEQGKCDLCGAKLNIRTDDNEETIKARLEVYRVEGKELLNYYNQKGILYTIIPKDPNAEDVSKQAVEEILIKVRK